MISSTAPKEDPEENDFLCASMAKRAALTFGGVGGRGKDGGGLILLTEIFLTFRLCGAIYRGYGPSSKMGRITCTPALGSTGSCT